MRDWCLLWLEYFHGLQICGFFCFHSFFFLLFILLLGNTEKSVCLLACSIYSGHRLFDRGSRSSTRHNSVFVDIWWRDAARVSFIPFWPNYYPAIFNSCCSFCILLKNIFRFVCSFELKWSLNSSLDTQNLGWECGVRSHPGKSDLIPIKRRKMVEYSGE